MEERIGHYTIVSELGRGGMGVVYKAHEESLNRIVALKVLGKHLSEDKSFVERFKREAQSAAAMNHPNIVQVYSIDEFDGQHCFAMEYVQGSSIQQLIKKTGQMDPVRAARLVLQAASGLGAAHGKGIYHRDIKPANLMVDESGLVKIADFGLALLAAGTTRLTSTGMFMGTPGYLSPEQCLSEDVDQRTDIYSLGVTLYEMLTGVTPLKADSPLALLRQIIDVEPRDVGELRPEVPESLRLILRKMMAKKPDERYPDCAALIVDMQNWLENASGKRVALQAHYAPGPTSTQDAATVAMKSGGRKSGTVRLTTPGNTRGNIIAAVVIVVSLLVLVGGVYAAWRYIERNVDEKQLVDAHVYSNEPSPGSNEDTLQLAKDEALQPTDTDKPYQDKFAASKFPESSKLPADEYLDLQTGVDDLVAEMPDNIDADISESATELDSRSQSNTINGQSPDLNTESAVAVLSSADSVVVDEEPQQNTVLADSSDSLAQPYTATVAKAALGSGVALVSVGEPLLANAAADYVRQSLARHGIAVIDGMSIPGVATMLENGGGAIQKLLRPHSRYLVFISADYIGERELNYMGRYDLELQARLNLDTNDLLDGKVIGPGIHTSIGYTSLSVNNKVQELLRPGFAPIAGDLTE
jgi:serine/threonine protein kinase